MSLDNTDQTKDLIGRKGRNSFKENVNGSKATAICLFYLGMVFVREGLCLFLNYSLTREILGSSRNDDGYSNDNAKEQ